MLKSKVASVFKDRRNRLMKMDPDGCFVFFGASLVTRNSDVEYGFRQNSDFLYLTDVDEEDAILVLVGGKSYLFVLDRELDKEIWTGERYGVDRAKQVFEVDETFLVKDFYSKLEELLVDSKRFYYDLGQVNKRDSMILSVLRRASRYLGKGSHGKLPILDPAPFMGKMRIIKDAFDLMNIKKAASISARAHLMLLKRVRPGMTELEAMAEFQYFIYKNGGTDLAYGPIFAGGANATTLHYCRNNEILKLGDLILIDAGAEVNGYAGDITQTFPISKSFSPEQKQIYQNVLEVNRQITLMIKPGVTYRQLHEKSAELLTERLIGLGVLQGSVSDNVATKTYRKYYPHGLGHYLGLDVHDAGNYDERGLEGHPLDVTLEAGMILTVEPGLYFRDKGTAYSGIGVRIEDDVLVTETGFEVLTHELPRDVEAIENLRAL